MFAPCSVSVPVPVVVSPPVPARIEPIVAETIVVIVGVLPPRLMVPLLMVAVFWNVIPLTQTAPLTLGVAAVLKVATFFVPWVASQSSFPVPPFQLVLVVSHAAQALPVQVKGMTAIID